MSERTEVMVEIPVSQIPTGPELQTLYKQGFAAAKKLVGPGRVLGVVSQAVGTHKLTGMPSLLLKFAVEAPESIQPKRNLVVPT